jgi:hypothetical protein
MGLASSPLSLNAAVLLLVVQYPLGKSLERVKGIEPSS